MNEQQVIGEEVMRTVVIKWLEAKTRSNQEIARKMVEVATTTYELTPEQSKQPNIRSVIGFELLKRVFRG